MTNDMFINHLVVIFGFAFAREMNKSLWLNCTYWADWLKWNCEWYRRFIYCIFSRCLNMENTLCMCNKAIISCFDTALTVIYTPIFPFFFLFVFECMSNLRFQSKCHLINIFFTQFQKIQFFSDKFIVSFFRCWTLRRCCIRNSAILQQQQWEINWP